EHGGDVVEERGGVGAAGDQATAVGQERQTVDGAVVAAQAAELPAGADVPEMNAAGVASAGQQPAGGRRDQAEGPGGCLAATTGQCVGDAAEEPAFLLLEPHPLLARDGLPQ